MPNLLLIAATHGNEGFSIPILNSLSKKYNKRKYNYDWIVGNPRALEKNIRFTESDLNRVAPGNSNSKIYEEKRSSELIKLSSKYKFIIDIHGTDAKSGTFVLITNPILENLILAASLPIKNVVIWATKKSLIKGPVTQYTKCPAVEIECGPKSSPLVTKELKRILTSFVKNSSPSLDEILENIKRQSYFWVYGKEESIDTRNLKEFKKIRIKDEEFYPLLVNSYKKGSTRKMKKLDLFNLLCY